MKESILPSTDRRSPFYMETPPPDAKPIDHLVRYFKLWKHFIAALTAYLKDLLMAKEFEQNLNLQLVGSVQFPGFRNLPFRAVSEFEQNSALPTLLQLSTPKTEKNLQLTPSVTAEMRPGLAKTKSASSFLKNQTFAHRRTNSSATLSLDGSAAAKSKPKPAPAPAAPLAAMLAPKSDVTVDETYFPPDLLFPNMAQCLVHHHSSTYAAQQRLCRELQKLVPKLESLHRNLGIKIKEIKSLLKNESFANLLLVKEVSRTGAVLNTFIQAVQKYSGPMPVMRHSEEDDDGATLGDPFLTKLRLDFQLKTQLIHENYVFALYVNLQGISKDLLNYVLKELNGVSERLIRATSAEAVYATSMDQCAFNLGASLRDKIQSADYLWLYFMSHNPNFLNIYVDTPTSPKRETRSLKDVVVPYANSIHSKCLRCGYMYKKQKVLKSYVSSFYLLTANFLHEFKIEVDKGEKKTSPNQKKKTKGKVGGVVGHDDTPTKSYNLNDYTILVKEDKEFKFVLTKVSNRLQKFSFKCNSEADFVNWTTDLFDLLKFSNNHLRRFKFIEDKLELRDHTPSSSDTSASESQNDLHLNLSNLLSNKVSLKKIQPQSLNGIFTPKVQSPTEQSKNPFESDFAAGVVAASVPITSGTQSPVSPVSETGLVSPQPKSPSEAGLASPLEHQNEHEHYLQLQTELMAQQQKLLEMQNAGAEKPSLSRNLSADSFVSELEPLLGLLNFLDRNKNLVSDQPAAEFQLNADSLALVPTVFVLNHDLAS